MSGFSLAPKLSLLDQADTSGLTSLDPLGLEMIAERLAVRMVPGVRERQRHPRFLTAIAASHHLCADFAEDAVSPKDGVSEPWQVFEWYLVEAFVRTLKEDALKGLPGRDKAAAARRAPVPLCKDRYLKTPSVFGFHGVYRTLARDLGIEEGGCLGSRGYELLKLWEEEKPEQRAGFVTGTAGPGRSWVTQLREAVTAGLAAGAVSRSDAWAGWRFLAENLHHLNPGQSERGFIASLLLDEMAGNRRAILEFLVSPEGQDTWKQSDGDERPFHEALIDRASGPLTDLLHCILLYESFARLLMDAFDACRFCSGQSKAFLPMSAFADQEGIRKLGEEGPGVYANTVRALSGYEEDALFESAFQCFAYPGARTDWVERIFARHGSVQQGKKRAPWWIERENGDLWVRSEYLLDARPVLDHRYVHGYRTGPLNSFARDLGMVQA